MSGAHHEQCLVCSSKRLKQLTGYKRVALLQCRDCGFVFARDIPTVKDLTDYYSGYGTTHYLSPITIKRYNEWLDEFEVYRETGNILDVGCGSGFFLEEAKKRGWHVYGTEFSDELVAICRSKSISMSQGSLNERTFDNLQFDVVISIEVLEHINNPVEEMQHIRRLLRPGGLFYCTTPNFNGISRYWLGDKYNIIDWPEHLGYFTAGTLRKLMNDSGFVTVRIETTGFSFTRFRGSLRLTNQKVVSSESDDEKLRKRIEGNALLGFAKTILNWMLNITRTGTSVKGRFTKVN